MDNFKLYVKNGRAGRAFKNWKGFLNQSNALVMELELGRRTKITLRSTKLVKKTNVKLNLDSIIQEMEEEKMPKYKGVNEENGIQHASMKKKIWKEALPKMYQNKKSFL